MTNKKIKTKTKNELQKIKRTRVVKISGFVKGKSRGPLASESETSCCGPLGYGQPSQI